MEGRFGIAATLFVVLFSQSCSLPAKPDLVPASLPNPNTPDSIAGPLLDLCLADSVGRKYAGNLLSANYDPSETLDFSERIFDEPWQTWKFADRIRAYSVQPLVRRAYETRYVQIYCYYEISNAKLEYLTYYQKTRDSALNEKNVKSAASRAAKKMARKDRPKTRSS
jgi:hypothetical protein